MLTETRAVLSPSWVLHWGLLWVCPGWSLGREHRGLGCCRSCHGTARHPLQQCSELAAGGQSWAALCRLAQPGDAGALPTYPRPGEMAAPPRSAGLTKEGSLEERGFKMLDLYNRVPHLRPVGGHLVSHLPAQADDPHTPPPGSPLSLQPAAHCLPSRSQPMCAQG